MRRRLFDDEHEEFRASFRGSWSQEMVPRSDEWDRAGIVDRSVFVEAGAPASSGWPSRPSTAAAASTTSAST